MADPVPGIPKNLNDLPQATPPAVVAPAPAQQGFDIGKAVNDALATNLFTKPAPLPSTTTAPTKDKGVDAVVGSGPPAYPNNKFTVVQDPKGANNPDPALAKGDQPATFEQAVQAAVTPSATQFGSVAGNPSSRAPLAKEPGVETPDARTVEDAFLAKNHPELVGIPDADQDTTPVPADKDIPVQKGVDWGWLLKAAPQVGATLLRAISDSNLMKAGSPELTSGAQNQAKYLQQQQLATQKWLAQNAPGYQASANIMEAVGKLPVEQQLQIIPLLGQLGVANIGAGAQLGSTAIQGQTARDVAGINQQTALKTPMAQSQADINTAGGVVPAKIAYLKQFYNMLYGPGGYMNGMGGIGPSTLASQYATDPDAMLQALLTGQTAAPAQQTFQMPNTAQGWKSAMTPPAVSTR